jgi:hypothetical protein
VESLKSPSFDAAAAVEKIKQLRTAADDGFRSGNTDIARASRSAAKALEDALEGHLQTIGQPDALQAFRQARQQIAKTYTVEKALNPASGSIDARKRSSLDRASTAEVVELWAPADLYDRIEAALRTKAGLAVRPTGAIVAGLGAAGDHGAKV